MNVNQPIHISSPSLAKDSAATHAEAASGAPHTIAVLGTGKMGSTIASRLSEVGYALLLWNRTRSRAEALRFGSVADTPAAAVRAADLVISSLTGPEAVMATYAGPDGALAAGAGKAFVEMSTAGADLVPELAKQVKEAGGTLVDAPIIGAPPFVRAGEAAILVGGSSKDVEVVSEVLGALGTVRHVGPLGSAARLKLVANSMLADVMAAAAELQVAGEAAGLDPEQVFWILERLAPSLDARKPGLLHDQHAPLFAMRDLHKDLGFALSLFGRSAARTPLTHSASELVTAVAEAAPDFDISAVVRPYREAVAASVPAATR
jgi:3-hydroxyisobutyrate dehydrogenase